MNDLRLEKQLNWLEENGPMILLVFAVMAFCAVWVFKYDFYHSLLGRFEGWHLIALAGLIATITQGARFALLVATVSDFGTGNKRGGWLGLIGSIGFVAYEIYEAQYIAAMYSNAAHVKVLIVFVVLVSLGLEFRIVLSLLDNVKTAKALWKSKRSQYQGNQVGVN
jgi:hypothetical protein